MANTIKIRRSATAGAVPTTTQLQTGELALNTADGKLFAKKVVDSTESIVQLSTDRFTQTIGDGTATEFTIQHNFNTRDVYVAVYETSSPYEEVTVDVAHNLNDVKVTFATAPSSNSYRVVVIR